jgi:hypothetical protein
MRLPRWILVVLLAVSAVALVAVPAWLWVSTPRRTAANFIAAIEAGDAERMNAMLSGVVCRIDPGAPAFNGETLNLADMQFVLVPAEGSDLLRGHRTMIAKTRDGFDVGVRFRATCRDVTMDTTAIEAQLASEMAIGTRERQDFRSLSRQRAGKGSE